MSWIELDDGILEHPKFIRAARVGGSEAIHFWLGLRAYCAKNLTNGRIPGDMLDEVRGPKGGARRRALECLVEVGLVHRVNSSEDIEMHDYLDWASSREQIMDRRDRARVKKSRQRSLSLGDSSGTARGVPGGVPDPRARVPLPLPLPNTTTTPVGGTSPVVVVMDPRSGEPVKRAQVPKPKVNPLTEDDVGNLKLGDPAITDEFIEAEVRDWLLEPPDPTDLRWPDKWRVHAVKLVRGRWRDQATRAARQPKYAGARPRGDPANDTEGPLSKAEVRARIDARMRQARAEREARSGTHEVEAKTS